MRSPTCSASKRPSLLVAVGMVAAWAALSAGPATAEPASLEGSWSGSGTVVLPSGESERARCRATFRRQSSDTFTMRAVCSTASTSVAQTAELTRTSGSRYSGEFFNSEYGISGSIRISVSGSSLSASLSGGGGTGRFHLSR